MPFLAGLTVGIWWVVSPQRQHQLDQPTAFGVNVIAASLSGRLAEGAFQLEGDLQPPEGQVSQRPDDWVSLSSRADLEGLRCRGSSISPVSSQQRVQRWAGAWRAEDLGRLVINTFGGSDGQLKALARSRQALLDYERDHPQRIEPADLRGRVDGTAIVNGPDPASLNLDLQVRGHLGRRCGS